MTKIEKELLAYKNKLSFLKGQIDEFYMEARVLEKKSKDLSGHYELRGLYLESKFHEGQESAYGDAMGLLRQLIITAKDN